VLLIPQLMNLEMYLEMRMMTAYSALWDDVTKQFTSHSSPTVLKHASGTIRHLTEATSLANANSTKILELEDELASALRNAVAGKEELDVAGLEGDEVLSLGAMCARVAVLAGVRDIVGWMEEDEGGKQSKPWDIVCALVERGRLGYKEEETVRCYAVALARDVH
jgi:cohesin complex subunit SA-1/2